MKLLTTIIGLSILFSGCASLKDKLPFVGKKEIRHGGVYTDNLDPDRIIDLIIVKRLTGKKILGIFNKYIPYLEGYIRGSTVDYDDNPIQGVIVRVTEKDKDLAGYDPGVSDANGIYKIRFSLPIPKTKKIDMNGTVSYNPPWQQQLEILGVALEPQTKETKFRLYYDQKTGIIAIGEDTPKTITRKITEAEAIAKANKQSEKKSTEKKTNSPERPKQPTPTKNNDGFGGFGDFK